MVVRYTSAEQIDEQGLTALSLSRRISTTPLASEEEEGKSIFRFLENGNCPGAPWPLKFVAPEIGEDVVAERLDLREWLSHHIGEHLVPNPDAETAVVGSIPDARLAPGLIGDTLDRLSAIANLLVDER